LLGVVPPTARMTSLDGLTAGEDLGYVSRV
jgi:hypothetical protein